MNNKYIAVFDFETDGANPQVCEPVQLATVMIDPIKLDIVPDSTFCSYMRPINIDDADYYEKHLETIAWHARNYNTTPEGIFSKWKEAPQQRVVFSKYQEYLLQYHCRTKRPSHFSAPIPAGANIINFDLPIIERLCARYGALDNKENRQTIFSRRDKLDTMNLAFLWFENLSEPESYSMESLRDYFGLSHENSHDALKDIMDCSEILIHFMKLHRKLAPKVQFKGALVNV